MVPIAEMPPRYVSMFAIFCQRSGWGFVNVNWRIISLALKIKMKTREKKIEEARAH